MTETSSGLMVPRRNFIKMCAVAGGLTLFPWLAYASEADDLDAKADQLQENANAMQAQADEVAARLSALQDQYNAALDRYNAAIAAHDAAVAAMEEAQDRIDAAEIRIAELQEQLSVRVNAMYKHGSSHSFLDVLMGSSSFEDFTTNLDAIERVSEQDARLVQESKDAKAEAQAARDEYARQEAIAAEEVANAEAAKEELEAAQASLQAEYDKMNEDIAAANAEIEQIRMDAEEARKREEEAKKAAQDALDKQTGGSVTVDGWVNPAPGEYITSGFGWRPSIGDYHQGVDLSSSYEPVYCMAAGTVTTAGWFGSGGLAVTVNHGGGLVSWYLHGSSLNVSVGQQVSAGECIMTSGSTGFSTGPHLHFQINVDSPDGVSGTAIDPTGYFGW